MNAAEFLLADGRPSGLWYCTACLKTRARMTKDEADRCCVPIKCKECGEPIEPDKGHYTEIHYPCHLARKARQTAAAIEKAEKLDAWDGWVYVDDIGPRDGYFDSLESLVDYLADYDDERDPEDWPEWAFVCEPKQFVRLDADRITEDFHDEAYEDWDSDSIRGMDELRAACAAFNEANKDAVVYREDRGRVVRVPSRAECLPAGS